MSDLPKTRVVWKFTIDIDRAAVGWKAEIPQGARFLAAAKQYDEDTICAWFEVDPQAERILRMFTVYGTGRPIHNPRVEYLGTTLHYDGSLVLHLYIDPEG